MHRRINVWIQRFSDRKSLMLLWVDPQTGKTRSRSAQTADAKEAEKRKADLEYELNHGIFAEPNKMPWETFRKLYENEKLEGHKPNTKLKVEYVFASFEKLASPRTLGAITERTFSQYIAELRKRGRTPATIVCHLSHLKAAMRWANDQRLITALPKILMPKVPKGSNKKKIRAAASITGEAFERLLAKCPNNSWRLLISLCWYCGMRRTEARSVRGEHVDLARRRIAIPENKAGDEAATAFITPELDAILRERWPDGPPEGSLITAAEVTSDVHEITKQFKRIAKKAGVKGGGRDGLCCLHDLRRAFGSRWATKTPAQALQRLMRHADIKTTMDFYADVEEAALEIIWAKAKGYQSDKVAATPTAVS